MEKLGDVVGCSAVKCLEGEKENFELYALVYCEPVKGFQDW